MTEAGMSGWRKYERDVDILLAEEFEISRPFAAWFRQQIPSFADRGAQVVEVAVSKSEYLGESDLVLVYQEVETDRRFAIFIEDKIDAPLQPEQVARYRRRAEAGVRKGQFAAFQVVLCSPTAYRDAHTGTRLFDAFVSYEAIARYFRTNGSEDARAVYRAIFLETCAMRRVNRWERNDDPVTNHFWQSAYDLASREFPELEMKPRALTKNQTWIDFRPADMPTRPIRVAVSMKGGLGVVDLSFAGVLSRDFTPLVKPILEEGMTVHQTGKSVAIRLQIERFNDLSVNDAALARLRSAFRACGRLLSFYRSHRAALDEAALKSIPEPISAFP
jgi:hypothetical protein